MRAVRSTTETSELRAYVVSARGRQTTEKDSRRDTEGHSSELAVQGGDDLSDGLGGSGAGGDDVGSRTTSSTPVLGGGS